MKKLFSILLAASVLATPLTMAAEANAAPVPHKEAVVEKKKVVVHKGQWVKGRHLSAADRHRAKTVDYRHHHLKAPPHGYHWVRIGNNFLLVGITSGLISKVEIAH
ncbi:RcnB family protein [Rhizobium mayense]|uniref:RcnB family protein n=1 Tax=Rhizobium mayense TaxID=1312184 RepID=A0ABT7JW66_9HYPH|nr:RcnB family protein [Rhizobium mayense]MDL2400584.1 RcnB family protein [Rhizobium mayense]